LVVFHTVLLQKQNVFFLECLSLVMLSLVSDVSDRVLNLGRTNAERAVALLPRKSASAGKFLVDPFVWTAQNTTDAGREAFIDDLVSNVIFALRIWDKIHQKQLVAPGIRLVSHLVV